MIPITRKKGDPPDMMVFIILVTIFAIGLFILAFVIPQISDGLNIAGLNSTQGGADSIDNLARLGTSTMQNGFLIVFFGLIAGLMISSFFIRTHPIFIFIYIFFFIVTIIISVYMANLYERIVTVPIFAETLASQGFINAIMGNIVAILVGVIALSIVIIFAKFSSLRGGETRL